MSKSRWMPAAGRWVGACAVCTILACSSKSQTPSAPQPYQPSALAQQALTAAGSGGLAVGNDLWIRNTSQTAQQNRPFTISRFFAKGEIKSCPQALVDENPVETQCDVKTLWDDGTVQHSLVTFFGSIAAGGELRVRFVDQPKSEPAGLSKQEMLDFAGGKWGAAIEAGANVVDDSGPVSVKVKDILAAWDGNPSDTGVRYWMRGPLVTQVIVEDKSVQTPFDFGWTTPIGIVRNSVDILRKTTSFTVYRDYQRELASWSAPLSVYVNGEVMKVCTVEGLTVTICPEGRGLEGTKPRDHRTYIDVAPDAGWRKAAELRHKSLHPIFVLTFYRGWSGVKVEAIVENTWTQRLQNQVYNMRLMKGENLDEKVSENYEKVLHAAGTRWRRTFWSGNDPGPVSINYNLPYLIYSHSLPSYDLSRKVTEKGVAEEWNLYQKAIETDDFMGGAQWQRYFPAPGGRPDIAFVPRWYLRYLFTFNEHLEKVMLGNAEAAAHIPAHYRESMPGRKFCERSCTSPSPDALGRVLSIDARPTVNAAVNTLGESKGEDRLLFVGGVQGATRSVNGAYEGGAGYNGWSVDIPHQPGLAYVPYLITGDWYFLEEMQFWAAYNMTISSPAADCSYCRNEDWGYTATEVRGRAWVLRNLTHAAVMSPNGSAEKEYFFKKVEHFLAILEGILDIRDGAYYEPCPAGPFNAAKTTRWCWGRTVVARNMTNPLMHYELPPGGPGVGTTAMWTQNDFPKAPPSPVLPKPDAVPVFSGGSEWMIYYNEIVMGNMLDLGIRQVAEIHARVLTSRLLHILRDPASTPFLSAAYQMPVTKCNPSLDAKTNQYTCVAAGYFTDWDEIKRGFKDLPTTLPLQHIGDPEHGYAIVSRAAASYLYPLSAGGLNGKEAWNWIDSKIDSKVMDENPMWAIVPREVNTLVAAYKNQFARPGKGGAVAAAAKPQPQRDSVRRTEEGVADLPDTVKSVLPGKSKRGKRKK